MWQINRFDDYPFHQAAAPIDVPVQSDRHFNDGYWFAFYTRGTYAFCGMRLHPNNNVLDGYAGAIHAGVQRNVRFSRALRPRTNELAAGPLRIEIIEPLEVQRLVLGPNESGVEWDVIVTARALWPEAPHRQHRHGVVLNDVLRYTGITHVTGWMSIDGERLDVDWTGGRDHSWGIRASMGPRTPLGGIEDEPADPRAIRLWIPFECGDQLGFFHGHEDADGAVLDFEGEIVEGDRTIPLAAASHRFRYEPGSRRLRDGTFTLVDAAGTDRTYRFEVMCEPVHPQGFGYTRGWSDGQGPGVWRGPEVQEASQFDVTDPCAAPGGEHLPSRQRLGGTEYAAALWRPDGTEGVAHIEHMVYGTYRPYGFEGPFPWR
jgi:hypothetical protein